MVLNKLVLLLIAARELFFGAVRSIQAHDKKVTDTRYCKICGRLADFRVRGGFRDMSPVEMSLPTSVIREDVPKESGATEEGVSLLLVHNPTFRVCQMHHPDIGRNRLETREYMHKLHPKLGVCYIEPTRLL